MKIKQFSQQGKRSKNGIRVNNDQSKMDGDEEVYLADGDTFFLGHTQFRVTIAEQRVDNDDLTR